MSGDPASAPVVDVQATLDDVGRYQVVIDAWEPEQRQTIAAYRRAIETLNAEAFRRVIRAVQVDPAGQQALQRVATDDLVYGVLRHHGLLRASLQEEVETALRAVRPMLAAHNGDVELVRILPPDTVEVRFTGACDSCPASAITFHAGVKQAIHDHCPTITNIVQVKGLGPAAAGDGVRFISPFSIADGGTWLSVCKLADIPPAAPLFITAGGRKLILSHTTAGVNCFQNACAHMGWPLDQGSVAEGVLTCPAHGFRYDLASGECLTAPEVQLQAHVVRVIGDRVDVRLVD